MTSSIDRAERLLASAERVIVLTGAGMSAPSGVPTFRGADGLWKNYRPEQLATPEAFARDPRLVWEWYGWRRELIGRCKPNPGHLSLAEWMASREGVTLVTQNVDGLHEIAAEQAGAPEPVRLHGSIFRVRCTGCLRERNDRAVVDAASSESLPRCPECGSLERPAVVWFGEQLPLSAFELAGVAAREAEVCLVIGTSGVVYPAAGLAFEAASCGAKLVVVDPGETAYDGAADIQVTASVDSALPSLLGGSTAG